MCFFPDSEVFVKIRVFSLRFACFRSDSRVFVQIRVISSRFACFRLDSGDFVQIQMDFPKFGRLLWNEDDLAERLVFDNRVVGCGGVRKRKCAADDGI